MKLILKLLGFAGLFGAGLLVERWRQERLRALGRGDDRAAIGGVAVMDIMDADIVGIADVDPQPMTQISGEGIDPDVAVPPRAR